MKNKKIEETKMEIKSLKEIIGEKKYDEIKELYDAKLEKETEIDVIKDKLTHLNNEKEKLQNKLNELQELIDDLDDVINDNEDVIGYLERDIENIDDEMELVKRGE